VADHTLDLRDAALQGGLQRSRVRAETLPQAEQLNLDDRVRPRRRPLRGERRRFATEPQHPVNEDIHPAPASEDPEKIALRVQWAVSAMVVTQPDRRG